MRQQVKQAVPWRVLLIGGNSGAGKTTVAQELSRRSGISLLLVDDVRIAIQSVTTEESHRALHFFLSDPLVWRLPPEMLLAGMQGVAGALEPALSAVVAHHIAVPSAGALIIEGDGLLPEFASRLIASHSDSRYTSTLVRGIFLVEGDEAVVLRHMQERGRGFQLQPEKTRQQIARVSALYGRWLQEEAERVGVAVIAAQPRESLIARIMDRLQH